MNSDASAPAGELFFVRQRRAGSPRLAAPCVWLAATLGLACGASDAESGVGGSGAIGPIANAGTGGTPGVTAPVQEPTTPPLAGGGAGGTEANPEGIGLAGSAGTTGAQASSGAGGGPPIDVPVPGNCDVPPAASPLVGWAATPGLGLDTTTGGGNATPQIVTTLEALQDAVVGDEPAVIYVRGILAPGDVRPGSNKTIVGLCGAEIHGHLEIREVENVIIRNLHIVGYGVGDCALDPGFDATVGCSSGDDAVIVQRNAHHIWFDHCSVRDGTDGNLDITNGANFVTISWTKFSYTPRTDLVGDDATGAAGHRYSNLVGGTDSPDDFDDAASLNVTWHHNWWADNVVERQPRIRFGVNHLFNNYYNSDTSNYCVRAGIQARVLLEGNFFDGVDDAHEFNNADDQLTANIQADASNVYVDTTSDRSVGGGGPPAPALPYDYAAVLEDAAGIPAAVSSGAGPQ
jgi:pectate lyase